MFIKKKKWIVLCVVCVISLIFVNVTNTVAEEKEKITITYWNITGEYIAAFKDYYTEQSNKFFEKLYPNVNLNAVTIPYETSDVKYLAAFAGRKGAPDMFAGKVPYFAGGLGVTDPAPADLQKRWAEVIIKNIQQFLKYEGKFYGWPQEFDTGPMLYYNVDMFKEAGLGPNRFPKTMDELLDYATKLTVYGEDGAVKRAGFAVRYSGNPRGIADKWLPFLHAYGGRLYGPKGEKATGYLNSPDSIASLQFYGDLVRKYKVASTTIGLPMEVFARGAVAMIFRESFLVGWLRDNAPDIKYKVAPIPNGKVNPGISLLFSTANMVYKFSPHKDMVWNFVRFITTKERDMKIAEILGTLPVYKENFDIVVRNRPDAEAIKELLNNPPSPYYGDPFINEIAFRVGSAVSEVLFGKKTAKKALDDAARDVDSILARKELFE